MNEITFAKEGEGFFMPNKCLQNCFFASKMAPIVLLCLLLIFSSVALLTLVRSRRSCWDVTELQTVCCITSHFFFLYVLQLSFCEHCFFVMVLHSFLHSYLYLQFFFFGLKVYVVLLHLFALLVVRDNAADVSETELDHDEGLFQLLFWVPTTLPNIPIDTNT